MPCNCCTPCPCHRRYVWDGTQWCNQDTIPTDQSASETNSGYSQPYNSNRCSRDKCRPREPGTSVGQIASPNCCKPPRVSMVQPSANVGSWVSREEYQDYEYGNHQNVKTLSTTLSANIALYFDYEQQPCDLGWTSSDYICNGSGSQRSPRIIQLSLTHTTQNENRLFGGAMPDWPEFPCTGSDNGTDCWEAESAEETVSFCCTEYHFKLYCEPLGNPVAVQPFEWFFYDPFPGTIHTGSASYLRVNHAYGYNVVSASDLTAVYVPSALKLTVVSDFPGFTTCVTILDFLYTTGSNDAAEVGSDYFSGRIGWSAGYGYNQTPWSDSTRRNAYHTMYYTIQGGPCSYLFTPGSPPSPSYDEEPNLETGSVDANNATCYLSDPCWITLP